MSSSNFLLLYDLTIRDKKLVEDIASRLFDLGYSVEVAKLKDERQICALIDFDVVVINKPHFFYPFRLWQKLRGVRYAVLDTEGVCRRETINTALLSLSFTCIGFLIKRSVINSRRPSKSLRVPPQLSASTPHDSE